MSLLELSADVASILIILIPILTIVCSLFLIKFSSEESPNRVRRLFGYLKKPPEIKPIDDEQLAQLQGIPLNKYLKDQLLIRLGFVYLLICVFILGSIIATFYYIMGDLLLPLGQGQTTDIRTWSSISIDTPFTGTWYGSFPWYGGDGFPLTDTHENPWSWFFFIAALTDNPDFVSTMFPIMLLIPVLVSLVFLAPLAFKSLRVAFVPSLVLFVTGMVTMTSSIFRCFAEVFSLEFGSASILSGIFEVTRIELQGLTTSVILVLVPIIILLFVVFLLLGRKFSTIHQNENNISRNKLLLFIMCTYWMNLLSIIILT